MNLPTVVIVDDHPIVRRGLGGLLAAAGVADVVAEASSGEAAVELVRRLRPSLVVMDIHLDGMDGLEAVRLMVAADPTCRVLVVSVGDGGDVIAAALAAGARGYVAKHAEPDAIIFAVRAVARGDVLFPPPSARPSRELISLTPREHEVLGLISDGLTNETIATRLSLSEKTVRNHVTAVFMKLSVTTRAEAVVVGRRSGYGTP